MGGERNRMGDAFRPPSPAPFGSRYGAGPTPGTQTGFRPAKLRPSLGPCLMSQQLQSGKRNAFASGFFSKVTLTHVTQPRPPPHRLPRPVWHATGSSMANLQTQNIFSGDKSGRPHRPSASDRVFARSPGSRSQRPSRSSTSLPPKSFSRQKAAVGSPGSIWVEAVAPDHPEGLQSADPSSYMGRHGGGAQRAPQHQSLSGPMRAVPRPQASIAGIV
jgi:hypothetical protein